VLGFANSTFGGGVGVMTGRRSGIWHLALVKLSGLALASRLRVVKWYAHQAYRNRVSRVMVGVDGPAHIRQLPGIHLGHLKNGDPRADDQEGEDDRYDRPCRCL
jgi:hypothetical protein